MCRTTLLNLPMQATPAAHDGKRELRTRVPDVVSVAPRPGRLHLGTSVQVKCPGKFKDRSSSPEHLVGGFHRWKMISSNLE